MITTMFQKHLFGLLLAILAGCTLCNTANATDPAPDLLLAKQAAANINPADYWVSEKYDGVRAYWDGQNLRFRSGHPVHAPTWFTAALPPEALDGELWIGRGRFDAVSAIVRKQQPVDAEWRQVRYMLFEAPDSPGTFSERILHLQQVVARTRVDFLQVVKQFRVADNAALQKQMRALVNAGGEGLMLHRADALYHGGRSDDLLKLKPYLDAEAIVIAHIPGKGRLQGMLGALLLKMPDGKQFRLGSGFSTAERQNPPALGATVTYRYQALNARGIPRFARYVRVREEP